MVVRIHLHTKFQHIRPMHSRRTKKCLKFDLSLSRNTTKMRKINRPWTKCNHFQRRSGDISMCNYRQYLPFILKKIPGNRKYELFREVKMAPKWHKWPKSNHFWRWSAYFNMPFSGHSSHAFSRNARKSQIWSLSLSQNFGQNENLC